MVGIGNFHNSFFVKNYYLNLNFFQVLQSALLKTPPQKKKNSQKRCKPPKIAWHDKRQKKNIEKQERKTKNEKKSKITTINTFLLLLFYIEKFTFC